MFVIIIDLIPLVCFYNFCFKLTSLILSSNLIFRTVSFYYCFIEAQVILWIDSELPQNQSAKWIQVFHMWTSKNGIQSKHHDKIIKKSKP
jgi:hypothetical protein